jgi:hypothetical protein
MIELLPAEDTVSDAELVIESLGRAGAAGG